MFEHFNNQIQAAVEFLISTPGSQSKNAFVETEVGRLIFREKGLHLVTPTKRERFSDLNVSKRLLVARHIPSLINVAINCNCEVEKELNRIADDIEQAIAEAENKE